MGKTIMIVDKDYTVRSMIRYILSAEFYTVVEACDAEEALGRLDNRPELDLMVIGTNLQETECVEILKRTRAISSYRSVPILMLAPERTLCKQMEWKEAGATCWIIKPFTAEQFLKMVEMVTF